MKIIKIIIFVFISFSFLLIFGCSSNDNNANHNNINRNINEKNNSNYSLITLASDKREYNFFVQIAGDEKEQKTGLMFQKNLEKDKGMFFIFDDIKQRSFWMKNTIVPLTILFFDDKGNLLNKVDATPCVNKNCEIYNSKGPAKYVLEINQKIINDTKLEITRYP